MERSSLFVRQVGMYTPGASVSMYEVRDAREPGHIVAVVSGPSDAGRYGQIFKNYTYRELNEEELDRVNALINLQSDEQEAINAEWDGILDQD